MLYIQPLASILTLILFDYVPRARLQWFFRFVSKFFLVYVWYGGRHVPQHMCGNQNNSVESFLSVTLHRVPVIRLRSSGLHCFVASPLTLWASNQPLDRPDLYKLFLFEGLPFSLLKLWVCFLEIWSPVLKQHLTLLLAVGSLFVSHLLFNQEPSQKFLCGVLCIAWW